MGVDHGGGHIDMAEQVLHGPDVVPRLQQMGGETAPQSVRRDQLDDVSRMRGALEGALKRLVFLPLACRTIKT
jgi:hypothetical protein